MSVLNAFLNDHEAHDSSAEGAATFDTLLDRISNNMLKAAQIPFSKRTMEYDIRSSPRKRRGNTSFQFEDRSGDYSFASNSRSFSREYSESLPTMVAIRPPSLEELGFLEALNNPEYLQAVKDLSEPLDLRYTFETSFSTAGFLLEIFEYQALRYWYDVFLRCLVYF